MSEPTESEKYVHLTRKYLLGNGVDIGCGSKPVIPSAIALDLPPDLYAWYHSEHTPERLIQWGGTCENLPFKDGVCDYVYSSHLIEDFFNWDPILIEWHRVLKVGGNMVILVPDKVLWNLAIENGQPPNCEHRHESHVGDLSEHFNRIFPGAYQILEDRLSGCYEGDYNIIFAAKKLA